MKGIIYTRVSSDDQVQGTSLKSQEDLCLRYCEQNGIAVVAVYREEGETAKDLTLKNRRKLLSALAFCQKEKDIGAFVVFKVDRFARSTEDHFAVRRILRGSGTNLHSVTEPIGDKPAEKFIETVLAGAAEYDNAIRTERSTGGMLARINQGIWPFRAPIGYACARHKKRGEKKTIPDEPHPALFPLIQRGLRAYARGELVSQAALKRQLNLWGFASAYGKPAFNQLVNNMLTTNLPFYAGRLVNPWTKKEQPGLHAPMISVEDYERIRARRLGKLRAIPVRRIPLNSDFPLRQVLRCPSCDRFMTGAWSIGNGGKYGYYFCQNKACAMRSKGLREDRIRPRFTQYLRQLSEWPGEYSEIEQRVRLILKNRACQPLAERDARAKRLAELSDRRRRICEMLEDGTYDRSVFRVRLAGVDQEISELNARPEAPRSLADVDPDELAASISWMLPRAALWRQKVPILSRPRFDKVLFPEGIRYENEGEFRTTKPGLIFALFGGNMSQESMEVLLLGFNSNQLYEYFEEVIALYRELKDADSEQADVDSAA